MGVPRRLREAPPRRGNSPAARRNRLHPLPVEAIHPFIDGNGRVGRLLITLLLAERGLLAAPLLDLSTFIESRRDEYYAHLLAVSTRADWSGWLSFFLSAVQHQAGDALARVERLQALREEYHGRMATARSSALLGVLIDALFTTPATTITLASELLGVTPRAARLNIDKLIAADVLAEISGRQRNKLFVAQEILETVEL